MDSLGTYIHEHELANIKFDNYNIVNFSIQPEQPVSSFTFKRNGREIPIYETSRLVGTVVGKDLVKSTVNILTVDSGVVSVKFTKDYFARYNRRISEIDENGINKVVEAGWFNRGSLIMVNGFRRGNVFIAKKYKKTNSHQLYKITKVHNDGTIEITNSRYGEEEEE
jgi:DNA polymerase-3 subunit alpha